MMKKILKICSLFLMICMLISCSENFYSGNVNHPDGMGFVRIYLEPANASTESGSPRTFLPVSNNYKYVFRFTSPTAGEKIWDISEDFLSKALETGSWNLEVIRYEIIDSTPYPVARGTTSFVLPEAGSTYTETVTLTTIPGGTGFFSFTINSEVSPVKGTLLLKAIEGGAEYGFHSRDIPAEGLSETLANIPAGDYDVFVSLLTEDGKRGSGKYSAAIIFPGIETSIDDGYFDFTEADFVQELRLAGTLVIEGFPAIPLKTSGDGKNVTITAIDSANSAKVFPHSYTRTGPGQEWIMSIDPGITSVRFMVEVIGDDGYTYVKENALTINDIPPSGKDSINLSIGIYTVNTAFGIPSGNSVTLAEPRAAFIPGETVNLALTSTYGLRPGTLKALLSSGEIAVNGTGTNYSFTMPEGNITLMSASFFTANLSSLSLTSAAGPAAIGFSPENLTYTASVPYSNSVITVTGAPEESESTVMGLGSYNLKPEEAYDIFVRVAPPSTAGGSQAYKEYKITVTRDGPSQINTLSSIELQDADTLTVLPNPVLTGPGSFSYEATVEFSVSKVKVSAAASDPKASVLGNDSYDLAEGLNVIHLYVIPESGTPVGHYTLTIYRKEGPSQINTLSSIGLQDADTLTILPNPVLTGPTSFSYETTVAFGVIKVKVSAAASDPKAAVTGNDSYYLVEGLNVIHLYVTPENGTPVGHYTLVIYRESFEE